MAPTVPSAGDPSQRPAGKSGSSRQGWGHSRGFRSSQHRAAPASFRDITSLLCCKCSSHLLHLIPFQLLSLALRASLPVPRAKHGVSLGWREGGGGAGCAGQRRDLVTSGGTGRGAHGPPAAPLPPPGPAGSGTPKLPRGNVVVPEPSAVGRTSPRRAGSCSLGRQKLRTRGHRPRSAPSPHSSSSCGRMGRGGCSLGPPGRSTQPEHPLSPPPVSAGGRLCSWR